MQHLECGFEIKFAGAEGDMTFDGYGAVFGNVDSYGDVIAKGAFKETLREARKSGQWPAMLSQHGGMFGDDMTPIGVWTDLEEDDVGLRVSGRLAATPRGQEIYTLMKMQPRPAISGLSIGFIAKEWSIGTKPDEPRRTLKRIHLMEISPVTFPANPKARVATVKAMADSEFDALPHEIEAALTMRGAGLLSRSEARALMRGGFDALKAMRGAGEMGDDAAALQRLIATLRKE